MGKKKGAAGGGAKAGKDSSRAPGQQKAGTSGHQAKQAKSVVVDISHKHASKIKELLQVRIHS